MTFALIVIEIVIANQIVKGADLSPTTNILTGVVPFNFPDIE
jgi:hypothetical protein